MNSSNGNGRAPLLKWSAATWKRWSAMPRLSTTTVPRTHFLLLKAPVSTMYEEKFGGNRNVFTVPMYLQRLIAKGIAVGLVVDCTALDLALFDPDMNKMEMEMMRSKSDNESSSSSTFISTRRYFNNVNEWDEFGVDYYQLLSHQTNSNENNKDNTATTCTRTTSSRIPSPQTIQEFITVCTQHMKENPTMKIAVYDARGSSGVASFLVAYYLCHKLKAPVTTALNLVAKASPPPSGTNTDCQRGLYDVELIKELQRIFSGKKEIRVDCTKIPKWWFGDTDAGADSDTSSSKESKSDESPNNDEENNHGEEKTVVVVPPFQGAKRSHDEINNSNQNGGAGAGAGAGGSDGSKRARKDEEKQEQIHLPMQELPSSSQRYTRAMTVVKQLTAQQANNNTIPIREEVVLSMENVNQLLSKMMTDGGYKVTWRSVGRRGLLLILSDGIYFLEHANANVKVSVLNAPLYVPNPQKPSTVQHRTLLDVTLVMDREKGGIVPRFLVTDILSHMGGLLVHKPFSQRLKYMMDGVIMARKKSVNIWKYEREGIKMRAREYFDWNRTEFVMNEVMKAQMHDTDGVLFVSSDLKYGDGDGNSFVVETKDASVTNAVIDHTKNLT